MEIELKRLTATLAACGLLLLSSVAATVGGVYDRIFADLCLWFCPHLAHLLTRLLICYS
jgi:hypothetical protein